MWMCTTLAPPLYDVCGTQSISFQVVEILLKTLVVVRNSLIFLYVYDVKCLSLKLSHGI